MANIIIIDNYDSFTHNLQRYLKLLKLESTIIHNNSMSAREILALRPSHIIISPGPCTPEMAGVSMEVIRRACHIPILGVCLGHQCLGLAYKSLVGTAVEPRHGKLARITLFDSTIIPSLTRHVGLYNSLVVSNLGPELRVTALDENQQVMAFEHCNYPHFGLQFHPESILTHNGLAILHNFCKIGL